MYALYRGCLHTGQRVTRFLPQRVNSRDATARHAAVYATQAGSLGYVAPLLDPSAEPLLQKLQRQMVLAQPQAAGLNPAAFRCSDDQSRCMSKGVDYLGQEKPPICCTTAHLTGVSVAC